MTSLRVNAQTALYLCAVVILLTACQAQTPTPTPPNAAPATPIPEAASSTPPETRLPVTEFTLPLCATPHWTTVPTYPRPLPYGTGYNWLDWSADGRRLAFADGDTVWLAAAPDFVPGRVVTMEGYGLGQVRWHPDQTYLAIMGGPREVPAGEEFWMNTIWLVTADGAEVADLFQNIPAEYPMRVKPLDMNRWLDQQRLAFQVHTGTAIDELWQIDIGTMTVAPVAGVWDEEAGWDGWTNLQPEGDEIKDAYPPPVVWFEPDRPPQGGAYDISPVDPSLVVIGEFMGMQRLAVADVGRREYTWLLTSIAETPQTFLTWSRDGSAFYYIQTEIEWDRTQPVSEETPVERWQDLWRWDVAARQATRVMDDLQLAAVAADDTQVAFYRVREEMGELGVYRRDTGATAIVRHAHQSSEGSPAPDQIVWSPTGDGFAYEWRAADGTVQLSWVSLAHNCQQPFDLPIQQDPERTEIPVDLLWSPDGESLALLLPGDKWNTGRLLLLHRAGD